MNGKWQMNISHFDFNFFKAKIYFEIIIPLLLVRFDNEKYHHQYTIRIKKNISSKKLASLIEFA